MKRNWSSITSIALFFAALVYSMLMIHGYAGATPQVYVSDSKAADISRYQGDGTGREELIQGYAQPNYLAVDETNQMIYWGAASRINRCAFDGSELKALYDFSDGVGLAVGMAVDPVNGFVYWSHFYKGEILRAKSDGSGSVEVLFDATHGVVKPTGLDIDPAGGKVYWTEQNTSSVFRANSDGSGSPQVLFISSGRPSDLALDISAGKVYWADNDNSKIFRGNADGSGPIETLFNSADGLANPAGMDIDSNAGLIYWVAEGGKTFRANSDGTGTPTPLYDITASVVDAQGVAAAPASGKLFFSGETEIWGGSTDGSSPEKKLLNVQDILRTPGQFVLDLPNNKIYMIDQAHSLSIPGIKRTDLDFSAYTGSLSSAVLTGSFETIFNRADHGLSEPEGLAFDADAGKLYWTDPPTQKIQRGNTDGSGAVEDLFVNSDGLLSPRHLSIDTDNGRIYWTDSDAAKILRGRIDGIGTPTELFGPADGLLSPIPLTLDLDNNFVYWGDTETKKIMRGKVDGSGSPQELFNSSDGVESPDAIALDIDSGKIFFADGTKVFRGNTDGSGTVEELITGLGTARGLVLTPDADGDKVPDEIDGCAADGSKTSPGTCGCGIADTDSDGDSTVDCNDGCASDPNKTAAGVCGCGTADSDTNANGIVDCLLNQDLKERIQALTASVNSLKPTNTKSRKKNKKRNKAQKDTKVRIAALADEIKAAVAANSGKYNLTDPAASLAELAAAAAKKARAARKTKSNRFKKLKKKARQALTKLDAALA